jgi:hypothetical protein
MSVPAQSRSFSLERPLPETAIAVGDHGKFPTGIMNVAVKFPELQRPPIARRPSTVA